MGLHFRFEELHEFVANCHYENFLFLTPRFFNHNLNNPSKVIRCVPKCLLFVHIYVNHPPKGHGQPNFLLSSLKIFKITKGIVAPLNLYEKFSQNATWSYTKNVVHLPPGKLDNSLYTNKQAIKRAEVIDIVLPG